MIIRPPAVEPDSQLQKQLCRQALQASLVREVQLNWYPTLGLKVLPLRRPQPSGLIVTRKVDAGSRSTVSFQDHA